MVTPLSLPGKGGLRNGSLFGGRSLNGLLRSGLRHGTRHRWQALLTLAGIVMGVAIVVAVDLANASARQAFALSLDAVAGRTTHRILGGSRGIDEQVFVDLRRQLGLTGSAPVVSDYVTAGGQTFTLMGVDPVSEYTLERFTLPSDRAQGFGLLSRPDGVVLSQRGAAKLSARVGEELEVEYRGKRFSLAVAAVVASANPAATEGLMLADIATAQALLGRLGTLDRIDLTLAPGQAERLADWLPPGLKLVESESRNRSTRRMTEAFHINLTAMSLLALLVGGLLIHNTMTFSVLQRRNTLGIFRSLGAGRGEIFRTVLLEASLYGAAGTALGLALGVLLARFLVDLVLRTINDLYFVLTVSEFMVSPLSLSKGVLVGMGVTLLAAIPPALEATRSPPVSVQQRTVLEQRVGRRAGRLFFPGLALLAAGWWLSGMDSLGLLFGFMALALMILGFTFCVPAGMNWLVRGLVSLLGPLLGCEARMTLRGISGGLSRTGLAVAALTVAVAATVGVGVMVASFRLSVAQWLESTLSGDIYIRVPERTSARPGPGLPGDLIRQLNQLPNIAEVDSSRALRVETEFGQLRLVALDIADPAARRFQFKAAGENLQAAFSSGRGVLVSEPLAYHRKLRVGDSIRLDTNSGPVNPEILGVFYDYTSSRGTIAIHRDLYRRWWRDDAVDSLSLHLRPGSDPGRTLEGISELVAARGGNILVSSSGEIRNRSLAIFDRTFAVTRVLRLLTILVAFIGVLGALMALQLERLRELAVLRAVGFTPRSIFGMVTGQTAVMGILAGLLSIPLGLLMAKVLIQVINLRSFGWSMGYTVPFPVLLEALALAVTAAVAAGCYPAYLAANVTPARVLREE